MKLYQINQVVMGAAVVVAAIEVDPAIVVDSPIAIVVEPPAAATVVEPPAAAIVVDSPDAADVLDPPEGAIVVDSPEADAVLDPPEGATVVDSPLGAIVVEPVAFVPFANGLMSGMVMLAIWGKTKMLGLLYLFLAATSLSKVPLPGKYCAAQVVMFRSLSR